MKRFLIILWVAGMAWLAGCDLSDSGDTDSGNDAGDGAGPRPALVERN